MYPSPRHKEIQNAVKTPKRTSVSPLSRLGKTIYWPFDLIFNRVFHLEAVKVLALPIALGVIASWTTQRLQWEANQNQILDDYFNQIEKLVLEADLMEESPKAGSIFLVRGRTIAALSELDLKRKNQLFAFLRSSGLTETNSEDQQQTEAIISFHGQNLSAIDLERADLQGVNLTEVKIMEGNLHQADLSFATVSNANLSNADLSKANLIYTDFLNSDLIGANLSNADLSAANLSNADLTSADLSKAILDSTNLSNAVFIETDLSKANLSNALLSKAQLGYTNLSNADLTFADLNEANLVLTNLNNANLSNADLSNVLLNRPNLRYTNLSNANLNNTLFVSTDLSQVNLSKAFLIATDLRETTNFTPEQLTGNNQPYLCGVALPVNITGIESNRDCNNPELPQVLADKHGYTSEEAKQIINEARNKQWD